MRKKISSIIIIFVCLLTACSLSVCGETEDFYLGNFTNETDFEKFGFEKSTEVTYDNGQQSAEWNIPEMPETSSLYPGNIPQKWSQYKYLNAWIYSDEVSNSKISFVTYVKTAAGAYFVYHLKLDFTGWKLVSIPLDDFLSVNSAKWTSKTSYFYITANGFPNVSGFENCENITKPIYIDSIWLSNVGLEIKEETVPYDETQDGVYTVADFNNKDAILKIEPSLGIDSEISMTNNISARWNLAETTQLQFHDINGIDMSPYKYFNMLCYAPEKTDSLFNIVVWTTEGTKTYKYIQPKVDWQGWNLLTIKLADFNSAYNATWATAKQLDFASNGWDLTPDGKTKLNIERIWFSKDKPTEFVVEPNSLDDIYVAAPIYINFSNRIASNVKNDSVVLSDENGNVIPVKLYGNGKTLKVVPEVVLEANTTYEIDFSQLKDYYGQSITGEQKSTFTTGKKEIVLTKLGLTTRRGIPITTLPTDEFYANATLFNPFDEEKNISMFVVSYNDDNSVKTITRTDCILNPGESKNISAVSETGARVEAFVCDNSVGLKLVGKNVLSYPDEEEKPETETESELEACIKNNIVTISGRLDKSISDYALCYVTDKDNNIKFISPVVSKNYINKEFKMNQDSDIGGKYNVTANQRNSDREMNASFVFIDSSMAENILKSVNDAKTEDDIRKTLADNELLHNENVVYMVYKNKPYQNYGEIEENIIDSEAVLNKVNNEKWTLYDSIISDNSVLLFNDSDKAYIKYKKMSKSDKGEVCCEISKSCPFNTLNEFIKCFTTQTNKMVENNESIQQENNKVSGGGGGGGKSSSTPLVLPKEPVVTENVNTNNTAEKVSFKDIESVEWAKNDILTLSEKGIISDDEYFRPYDNVTRAEFIKMLVLSFYKISENYETDFVDVKADEWYYPYVAFGQKNNFVTGDENKNFNPDKFITRQDIATMCNRVCKFSDGNVDFDDSAEISEYALQSVGAMQKFGVIKGFDRNFRPLEYATRAEVACIISRLINIKVK